MKTQLLNGETLRLTNDDWCEQNESDDLRTADIWFSGKDSGLPQWAQGFKIMFNCKLIHSSKTFKSMENKLNKLIETWNLKQSQ